MDTVYMAIHPVSQNSDFPENSDFQNSQKLDPIQIPAKTFQANVPAFRRYFGARN
jgi:hypothetical protein